TKLRDAAISCSRAPAAARGGSVANDVSAPEAFGPQADGVAIELVAVHGARVLANRVHDVPTNVAIEAKGGALDTRVVNNFVWNVQEAIHLGGKTAPQLFLPDDAASEASAAIATSNVIYGATSIALAAIGCANCLMANNSIA